MKFNSFNDAYLNLFEELKRNHLVEVNHRTNTRIKLLEGAYSFTLTLDGKLPVPGNRKYFPHIAGAEAAFQFMGTKNPEFILKKAPKLWSKFVEDGELKAAYGYRWRHAFDRDQLQLAIESLRNDPTTRQVYISSWDPRSDGLGDGVQPKNIPCPVGFTISRFNDDLHSTVLIRSSDIFVGLPYDVMSYSFTLSAIGKEIDPNVDLKTITFTLAHAHLYEPHWEYTEEMEFYPSYRVEPSIPSYSVSDILKDPEAYLQGIKEECKEVEQNPYNPLPVVIE